MANFQWIHHVKKCANKRKSICFRNTHGSNKNNFSFSFITLGGGRVGDGSCPIPGLSPDDERRLFLHFSSSSSFFSWMDDITTFGPMGLRDLCGVLVASGTHGSQGGVSSVDSAGKQNTKYTIKTYLLRQQCVHNRHNAISELTIINVKTHDHKACMVIYLVGSFKCSHDSNTKKKKRSDYPLGRDPEKRQMRW